MNPKIIEDLKRLEDELRCLKRALRQTWERPMGDEQRRVVVLRRTLTDLLMTIAWSRGRLHVTSPPREHPSGTPWDPQAHAAVIAARTLSAYADRCPDRYRHDRALRHRRQPHEQELS